MFKDLELGVFKKEGQCGWSRVTWGKQVENGVGDGQRFNLVGPCKG